jgi:hypothetical protein
VGGGSAHQRIASQLELGRDDRGTTDHGAETTSSRADGLGLREAFLALGHVRFETAVLFLRVLY